MATASGAGSSTSRSPQDAVNSTRNPTRPGPRPFRLLLLLVLLAAVAVVIGRPLAVEKFQVTTASMVPTLRPGDQVLVDTLTYDAQDVRRGDVIAFEDPERPGEVAIKRVVALPGDTITLRAGILLINARQQHEAYLAGRSAGSDFFGPTVVPRGHLFVLGDNRTHSVDSRFTGPIPAEDLHGRVAARVWPPGRMALL